MPVQDQAKDRDRARETSDHFREVKLAEFEDRKRTCHGAA
jgi:hypothetical protein